MLMVDIDAGFAARFEGRVLRWAIRLDTDKPEDVDRRFVLVCTDMHLGMRIDASRHVQCEVASR